MGKQTLANIVFVWKCLPDCILTIVVRILPNNRGSIDHWSFRNAENMARPKRIPITGDFADLVLMSTLCLCTLYFVSITVWTFFALLCGWGCFMYIYVRYAYLRSNALDFISTSTTFSVAWFLWGVPLSVVAAQIPHWFYVQRWGSGEKLPPKWGVMGCAFVASYALWTACYHFVVRPFRELDPTEQDASLTIAEVKVHMVYDWLNCNPVFALKCRYYFQDVGAKDTGLLRGHPLACGENPVAVRFFEIGKEYLFVKAQRQYMIEHQTFTWLEPEYWADIGSSWASRMMVPLLECLLPVTAAPIKIVEDIHTYRVLPQGEDESGFLVS